MFYGRLRRMDINRNHLRTILRLSNLRRLPRAVGELIVIHVLLVKTVHVSIMSLLKRRRTGSIFLKRRRRPSTSLMIHVDYVPMDPASARISAFELQSLT